MGRAVFVDGHVTVGAGLLDLTGCHALHRWRPRTLADLTHVEHEIATEARGQQNGHRGGVIWLTGLSGSGKSTIAMRTEKRLFQKGYRVYVLDGDNLRRGINSDLGFSSEDRRENIRRAGEIAALFSDAGVVVLAAFISPDATDRAVARRAAGAQFHEVFVRASLGVCERRDPRVLYRRARAGEIRDFTGVSAPYEPPTALEVDIDTERLSIDEARTDLLGRGRRKSTSPCALLRGPRMLPNLIIVGAQKCGTSALRHYLHLHPDICMSAQKELDFFVESRNWGNGLAWYESNFRGKDGKAKVYGEASPNYADYPATREVPQRMHSIVPGAKLIYIVRHPIERIISQYIHYRRRGSERRSLSEALKVSDGESLDSNRYLRRSKYYMQVTQFLNFFPRSSIFICVQEDLLERRRETLADVFRFLDVDDTFDTEAFSRLIHESRGSRAKNRIGMILARGPERGILRRLPRPLRWPLERFVHTIATTEIKRPVLDGPLRRQLIDILREDIEQFRRFSGCPFPEWTV
jgi:adenylyl-sulfate kinase